MGYPKNPETIILKNKYYPNGLKEIDIWNYYQRVKVPLLKQLQNRNVMISIMVEKNKPIIRRKMNNKPIRLTPKNYDQIVTGRTIAFYPEMTGYEEFGIIDIDITEWDGFTWAKKAAIDVYTYVMDKIPFIKSSSIRFTGKTSFHIICNFGRKMKIDTIRFLLQKFLSDSKLAKVYTIQQKRTPGIPNLDLSPNKYRGNYIALHSLSTLGLKCMEVPYNRIQGFQPEKARII
jgi:hypothetical protein